MLYEDLPETSSKWMIRSGKPQNQAVAMRFLTLQWLLEMTENKLKLLELQEQEDITRDKT